MASIKKLKSHTKNNVLQRLEAKEVSWQHTQQHVEKQHTATATNDT